MRAAIVAARRRLSRVSFGQWTFPLALLVICILAFGLPIPKLGFYQDDWIAAWFYHAFGPGVFVDFFARERPYLAYLYALDFRLLGVSPFAWQVFGLLARWVCAISAWWTLRQVWPGRTRQINWVALIFAVYPSFREQSLPVVYGQLYLLLTLEILSLGVMVVALRASALRASAWRAYIQSVAGRARPLLFMGLSLLLAVPALFMAEFFVALEILRPVFLWLVAGEKPGLVEGAAPPQKRGEVFSRLKQVFAAWAPFLVLDSLYAYWRGFVFKPNTYEPKLVPRLLENPGQEAIQLLQTLVQDAVEITIFAWAQAFNFVRTISPTLRPILGQWGIILSIAGLAGAYLLALRDDPTPAAVGAAEPPASAAVRRWSRQAIAIGGLCMLTMGAPYWFAGLEIGLEISNDRFTLVFTLGASLLLVGLVELLVRTRTQKVILVGVLVGLAAGLQLQTATYFQEGHAAQEAFFRQLAWRAPGLKPGTLILSNPLPFHYHASNALNAPLNWIYTGQPHYPKIDAFIYYLPDRLGNDVPSLDPGVEVKGGMRSVDFSGSTSQALVLSYDGVGCLQVLDPELHAAYPRLPEALAQAVPLSNLAAIEPQAAGAVQRVTELFGPPPSQDWCYYFERADLARQVGDWAEVVRLGDEGLSKSEWLNKNGAEYLPFIEGYAHQGQWERAFQLTQRAGSAVPALRPTLCATWQSIQARTAASPERAAILARTTQRLGCSFP